MYLVFEFFQDTWHSSNENPSASWHATLSCPLMASNYANAYLVPISFWMPSTTWTFQEPISFYRRVSRFEAFQTKVAHFFFWGGGNENSARSFSDRSFLNPPGLMDVRAFGQGMSAPKSLFLQDFKGLTEVFAPGISAWTSAGYLAPNLWPAFPLLIFALFA